MSHPTPDPVDQLTRALHRLDAGQRQAVFGAFDLDTDLAGGSAGGNADVRYWRELARECERGLRRLRHDLAEACERTVAERRRPDLDSVLLDHLLATVATIAAGR